MTDLEKWIADTNDDDEIRVLKHGNEVRLRRIINFKTTNSIDRNKLDYYLFYDTRNNLKPQQRENA